VGRTVDEAAILYSMLENACQSQLLAEAAAANGLPKKIIADDAAKFTAQAAQNPVSIFYANLWKFEKCFLTLFSTTSIPNSSPSLS
jgi:hypothetical protein